MCLSLFPEKAGTAAALLTLFAMLVAFLVGIPISHITTNTQLPLSIALAILGLCALSVHALFGFGNKATA